MFPQLCDQALAPKITNNEPQLKCPEPPPELYAIVHTVLDRRLIRRFQILGYQRERFFQIIELAAK